jgi:hypothetical protein
VRTDDVRGEPGGIRRRNKSLYFVVEFTATCSPICCPITKCKTGKRMRRVLRLLGCVGMMAGAVGPAQAQMSASSSIDVFAQILLEPGLVLTAKGQYKKVTQSHPGGVIFDPVVYSPGPSASLSLGADALATFLDRSTGRIRARFRVTNPGSVSATVTIPWSVDYALFADGGTSTKTHHEIARSGAGFSVGLSTSYDSYANVMLQSLRPPLTTSGSRSGTFTIDVPALGERDLQFGARVAATTVITPEPTSIILLGSGLAGLALFAGRRKRAVKSA